MLPENASIEIEPERAQRILRKLLGKLGDLEAEAMLRPSLYREKRAESAGTDGKSRGPGRVGVHQLQSVDKRSASGRVPPAHPFEHLLLQRAHRKPQYTYKRKRGYASGNSSDDSSESAWLPQPRSRGMSPLTRSPSLGSLSDTGMSSGSQDPALWLTTPRKKVQRRLSGGAGPGSLRRSLSATPEPPSFSTRVEMLGARALPAPANGQKAKHLFNHLVQLGQSLWLGQPIMPSKKARVLPLRIVAAFRTGQAIACSEGSNDVDYLDEIYSAIPPYLVRFVLWQHVVALCFLRAPAYADAVSSALWQVGAFFQQEYLIDSRLAALDSLGALLRPDNIAPLHLRAIDIGAESRFVTSLLRCISAKRAKSISSNGMCTCGDSLWLQFVSADAIQDADLGHVSTSDEERGAAGALSGNAGKYSLSRFAKWVARISSPIESTRMLAVALDDALEFVAHQLTEPCCAAVADTSPVGSTDAMRSRFNLALESLKALCSIIYTKLGCSAATVGGDGIPKELLRCINLLDSLVHLVKREIDRRSARCSPPHQTKSAHLSQHDDSGASQRRLPVVDAAVPLSCLHELHQMCRLYQTGLALLSLVRLKHGRRPAAPLVRMAKRLLQWLPATRTAFDGGIDDGAGAISSRSALAARFDALMEQSAMQPAVPPIDDRIWTALVLPLAAAGTSPMVFLDLAQMVADDLGKVRIASSIVQLASSRFDAIWSHHAECCAWQAGWSSAQSHREDGSVQVPASPASPADAANAELKEQTLRRLGDLAARLMQGSATKSKSGPADSTIKAHSTKDHRCAHATTAGANSAAAVAEDDELGLLLSRSRRRARSSK
ncbi:hypothetical protein GQ54DRAFT_30117 [Martensiomyces pterosporus]|nr:hypothetical protein GQ54DRAFT_30117 [Martensiomyces pterosporus]